MGETKLTGVASRHVGETSYTCAYPLSVLHLLKPEKGYDRLAARHLLAQRDVLVDATGGLWLRRAADGSTESFHNWARAHAWYLLGLVQTLPRIAHLPEAAELEREFVRAAMWVKNHMRNDALWSVFVDEPALQADTSGTAGIAAAFALGAGRGYLSEEFRRSAQKSLEALQEYLTLDGFLTGAAQSNKGGEALQRSDYRVIAQFSQGLYGLLSAALVGSAES